MTHEEMLAVDTRSEGFAALTVDEQVEVLKAQMDALKAAPKAPKVLLFSDDLYDLVLAEAVGKGEIRMGGKNGTLPYLTTGNQTRVVTREYEWPDGSTHVSQLNVTLCIVGFDKTPTAKLAKLSPEEKAAAKAAETYAASIAALEQAQAQGKPLHADTVARINSFRATHPKA